MLLLHRLFLITTIACLRVLVLFDTTSTCSIGVVEAWDISIELLSSPSNAFGGQAFGIQPKVAIYNQKKTFVHSSLQADVVVELLPHVVSAEWQTAAELTFTDDDQSPVVIHDVSQLGQWMNDQCQIKKDGQSPRMALVGGYANFTNLCIDKASSSTSSSSTGTGGYTLVYTLEEGNLFMGQLRDSSNVLTVSVGDAHHVGILSAPTTVKGGEVWSSSESSVVVAILDRGGNVISNINNGSVRAYFGGGMYFSSSNDFVFTPMIQYAIRTLPTYIFSFYE